MNIFLGIAKTYAFNIGDAFYVDKKPVSSVVTSLSSIIDPLYKNIFTIANLVLIVYLIFGGVTYILNAGSGNQEGMEKGKNALTGAVIGYAIVFSSFMIVKLIEFITGENIFNTGL